MGMEIADKRSSFPQTDDFKKIKKEKSSDGNRNNFDSGP
jgi:hypothetical protein